MQIFILFIVLSFGLYFLIADRLKIPYLKVSKAIMNMGRSDRKLTTVIETVLMDLSIKAAKFIPMDIYKKNRLQQMLTAAGIKMTPECYQANAILKALFAGLLVFPLAVFFFVKLGSSYFDYRRSGQFEWTAPAILFACLVFVLTAPTYLWSILGM